ncbi:MAG: hypothetical protein ACRDRI_12600 [Pseudonocardiaceae bacterium]
MITSSLCGGTWCRGFGELHAGQQSLLSPAPAASHGFVAAARHQMQDAL